VTISGILRAEELYGPAIANLKGKTVNNKAESRDEEPSLGPQEQEQQTMNVDIMFVNGMPFLFNVITPLRMMFAARLTFKSTQSISRALCEQPGQIKAKGFQG